MKSCTQCAMELPLEAFAPNKRTSDGLQSWCRTCTNARNRQRYAEQSEHELARKAEYRAAHTAALAAKSRDYRAAHRAEQRPWKVVREGRRRTRRAGHALVLYFTPDQLAQRLSMFSGCWICGGASDQTDHVKPVTAGGPHILANLRPICADCNRRKKNKWPYAVARPGLRG